MGRHSEKILVIDTETCGEIPMQICYDIGGMIVDRKGNVYYKFHYVVDEIFADLERMCTAYYANKFQTYIKSIYEQNIQPLPFMEIVKKIDKAIDLYNVTTISAYNLQFDIRALENTAELLFENRAPLFPTLKPLCIMCAACDLLYKESYCEIARERGWLTPRGRIKTSAECGFRYVSGNYEFEEAHRGLDDCEIEAEILRVIFSKHKPFDGTPIGFPMRKVWAIDKAMQQ